MFIMLNIIYDLHHRQLQQLVLEYCRKHLWHFLPSNFVAHIKDLVPQLFQVLWHFMVIDFRFRPFLEAKIERVQVWQKRSFLITTSTYSLKVWTRWFRTLVANMLGHYLAPSFSIIKPNLLLAYSWFCC